MRFSYSYSGSTSSSPSPSSLPPPPPPPTPNDGLLDITPRKSSFSSAMGMSSACAFPSWPNRPSLLESEESTASSYLSDEDLFPTDLPITPPSESAIDEESAASDPVYLPSGAGDLTTEEQIQMMRAAAEEDERRARFLAHVHAHARAQQAFKVAQLAAAERENAKRSKKKRPVASKKHRSSSSSAKASRM
ncbi:hypothetical protein TMatcc_002743 [Talaromyces marneffei ATCC 18224]|uniref:OefB n=2 Tax=Talaromyces marneffei TaxID=37727 RepID=B6Q1P5_TALMQ|nr:uncharacterized protein EYB26_002164 [Talaromyces marneffei]EEA28898.1 conserved hypothetical protein [Talaromyces marneffei ATCC 18224]KAE8555493.1 hypothetical protein EYB25_000189 [Talaromyces marneffei]QGA14509.1 hypothetical protein EYB26_002164 [Talaromyces marneffei]